MKKLYPPMYFKISLIAAAAFHFLIPLQHIISSPYNYFGVTFIIIGLVLNIWADQIFKKENNPISPDKKPKVLIERGPYKISRNPMYFGMALALFGTAVIFDSAGSILGLVIFILCIERFFIPLEEKNMEERFGKEFEIYKNKVRRWI